MSITEIRESKADMLTAQEVAKVLGCNPQSIRNAAQTEEGRKQLGFPVIVVGTRVRIPRIPFLSFIAA